MSFEVLQHLNYLAVVVAAVVWFAAGALWYAPPVMGKTWMSAGGIEMAEGFRPNPMVFVGTFVAYFVAAVATAMLARSTRSTDVGDGIVLGLVTGVGFAVTLTAIGTIYDRKPKPGAWFAINGAFNLIGYLIVAVIVTVWD